MIKETNRQSRLAESLQTRFLAQWDNPSTEHDARSILSAFKVGVWLAFFNVCMAVGIGITIFLLPEEREFRRLLVQRGMGPGLISTVQLALAWFFTLVLPLRASGLLDGPRWSGYFDQVVSTGISPTRFFLGKWLSSQAFVLVLMAASFPYVILFSFFGLDSMLEPLLVYAQIYLYANFLLIVTFAAGTFVYEWAAVVLVTLISVIFVFIEFSPTPSTLAFWTPTRAILESYTPYIFRGTYESQFITSYQSAVFFGVAIPGELFRMFNWTFLSLIAGVYVLIGPRHFFERGLNNFDSVVIPGDSKRAMFFRMRPLLTRRVQLAFFYENRSQWLIKHDIAIRAGLRLLLIGYLLFLSLSTFLSPYMIKLINRGEEMFIFLAIFWMGFLTLHTISTLRVRTDFRSKWLAPWGQRLDVVSFDVFNLVLLSLLAIALVAFGMGVFETELSKMKYYSSDIPANIVQLRTLTLEWIAITFIYLLTIHLVSKLMGLANLSRVVVFIFIVLYMLVSLLGPLLIGGLFASLARAPVHLDREPNALFEWVSTLAHMSPIARFLVTFEPRRLPFGDSIFGTHGFWLYFPPWIIFLSLLLISKLKSRGPVNEGLHIPQPLPPLLSDTENAAASNKATAGASAKEAVEDGDPQGEGSVADGIANDSEPSEDSPSEDATAKATSAEPDEIAQDSEAKVDDTNTETTEDNKEI